MRRNVLRDVNDAELQVCLRVLDLIKGREPEAEQHSRVAGG